MTGKSNGRETSCEAFSGQEEEQSLGQKFYLLKNSGNLPSFVGKTCEWKISLSPQLLGIEKLSQENGSSGKENSSKKK